MSVDTKKLRGYIEGFSSKSEFDPNLIGLSAMEKVALCSMMKPRGMSALVKSRFYKMGVNCDNCRLFTYKEPQNTKKPRRTPRFISTEKSVKEAVKLEPVKTHTTQTKPAKNVLNRLAKKAAPPLPFPKPPEIIAAKPAPVYQPPPRDRSTVLKEIEVLKASVLAGKSDLKQSTARMAVLMHELKTL